VDPVLDPLVETQALVAAGFDVVARQRTVIPVARVIYRPSSVTWFHGYRLRLMYYARRMMGPFVGYLAVR